MTELQMEHLVQLRMIKQQNQTVDHSIRIPPLEMIDIEFNLKIKNNGADLSLCHPEFRVFYEAVRADVASGANLKPAMKFEDSSSSLDLEENVLGDIVQLPDNSRFF